jgi:hypothetical protein
MQVHPASPMDAGRKAYRSRIYPDAKQEELFRRVDPTFIALTAVTVSNSATKSRRFIRTMIATSLRYYANARWRNS